MKLVSIKGRGAAHNPPNRFEPLHFEPEPEDVPRDPDEADEESGLGTRFLRDSSRTIIARNDSPDVGFETSINPYRGCEHGCIYCFARPTHEYLGFSAGLDFESRILVKLDAPELLRSALASPRWEPQVIVMSGVTDPYQPIERKLRITRRCLEVLAEFRNPVGIITKNHLVTRDIDVLSELASVRAVVVNISVTSLDEKLQRVMEPRTSVPSRRLQAIEKLARAGIPVRVMAAPIIPGLTDHELPAILTAARSAGAFAAGMVPVRLPYAVAPLFEDWLGRHFPDRKEKVLNRIRSMRGGRLNEPRFVERMHGDGPFAEGIRALFDATCRKLGLNDEQHPLSTRAFRRQSPGGQLSLELTDYDGLKAGGGEGEM
jgi:DNA repair photolyase